MGLLEGRTAPKGRMAWSWMLGMAPQLNSKAGPRVSVSTGVPSAEPKM